MNIYLTTKRKLVQGLSLPDFVVSTTYPPPSDDYRVKTITISLGEYVLAGKCDIVDEHEEIRTTVYRVTNDNGEIKEEIFDSYGLRRFK